MAENFWGLLMALGTGGAVTAIFNALLNRRNTAAEAEKTTAETEQIVIDAAMKACKHIMDAYRRHNDDLEKDLAEQRKELQSMRLELTAGQERQDQEIEKTNTMVLRLQLANEILSRQINSLGIKPLVSPSEISLMSVADLKDLAQRVAADTLVEALGRLDEETRARWRRALEHLDN